MKRILLGFGSLIVIMCLSGIAQAVMIDGKNWRPLSDTIGVGAWAWVELPEIYHTGEDDVRAGYLKDPNADNTINGIDFNGYVWASGAEVLHAFQCLTDEFPINDPRHSEPDHPVPFTGMFEDWVDYGGTWAQQIIDVFGGVPDWSIGWVRDRSEGYEPAVYSSLHYMTIDGEPTSGYYASFMRDYSEFWETNVGVWLYEAKPVPEASSILLVSTALIILAGFRKKFNK
jgi:hypothetical protein